YANVFLCQFALAQMSAACERAPDNATYRVALGIAQYRLGKFEKGRYAEALATLTRCDQSHPTALAFLAMTQHQVGQAGEARTWLDKAVQALKENPGVAGDGRLDRENFRREAEQVLRDPPGGAGNQAGPPP